MFPGYSHIYNNIPNRSSLNEYFLTHRASSFLFPFLQFSWVISYRSPWRGKILTWAELLPGVLESFCSNVRSSNRPWRLLLKRCCSCNCHCCHIFHVAINKEIFLYMTSPFKCFLIAGCWAPGRFFLYSTLFSFTEQMGLPRGSVRGWWGLISYSAWKNYYSFQTHILLLYFKHSIRLIFYLGNLL